MSVLDFTKYKKHLKNDSDSNIGYCTKLEYLKTVAIKFIIDSDGIEGRIDTFDGIMKRAVKLLDKSIHTLDDIDEKYKLAIKFNKIRGGCN